ncbi:hypothetical protein [Haloferax volcanii]|uniref:Uncharacterized protein n=1 Tax=Haloferax volcanii TaxID=2246 RepID=A0A558FU96_HALVO|nr:hypothetical protein [Haloferax volcanii]TVT89080.1 hypothetical protein FQA18_18670 [Haloferax volcanii]
MSRLLQDFDFPLEFEGEPDEVEEKRLKNEPDWKVYEARNTKEFGLIEGPEENIRQQIREVSHRVEQSRKAIRLLEDRINRYEQRLDGLYSEYDRHAKKSANVRFEELEQANIENLQGEPPDRELGDN